MNRVILNSSTVNSRFLFIEDRVRGLVEIIKYWFWVLSWYEFVVGIFEFFEFSGVGSVDVVLGVDLGSICFGVWGVFGFVGFRVDGVVFGCVMEDVVFILGVGFL